MSPIIQKQPENPAKKQSTNTQIFEVSFSQPKSQGLHDEKEQATSKQEENQRKSVRVSFVQPKVSLSSQISESKSIKFADPSFTPIMTPVSHKLGHSILRSKENPNSDEEKRKLCELQNAENGPLTTPDAKAARFKNVKSPIPYQKRQTAPISNISKKSLNHNDLNTVNEYLQKRMFDLVDIIEKLKEKSDKVALKRQKLDELISKNISASTQPLQQLSINSHINADCELLKLKSMVCRNRLYLETVNFYAFSHKKFGWKIPIKEPFVQLPKINFDLVKIPVKIQCELSKKELKKYELAKIINLFSSDIKYFL